MKEFVKVFSFANSVITRNRSCYIEVLIRSGISVESFVETRSARRTSGFAAIEAKDSRLGRLSAAFIHSIPIIDNTQQVGRQTGRLLCHDNKKRI